MADHALPRRRTLPALAALLACAALAGAPAAASAADPSLTLTALSPATWWQADGTFQVPLRLELGELVAIDRIEIEVVGLPGVLVIPAPSGLVSELEGLAITLPGIAGTKTIRLTAWVVGQPSYGVGSTTEPVTAQTVVTLAPPSGGGTSPSGGGTSPSGGGTSPVVTPISKPSTGTPLVARKAPRVLLLKIRTIKGKRYVFVKSSAAVRLQLVANRRVGSKWRATKRMRTGLVANKIRRVPLTLAKPGRYMVRAVIRDGAGLTGTRSVKLVLKAGVRR